MQPDFDVVVVGGGHNGLVAASYLAKAGKKVALVEARSNLGGASISYQAFPDFPVRLSRYSYLVSLFPDEIKRDLGLTFRTLSRKVSSYTPVSQDGRDVGLLVERAPGRATEESFRTVTGTDSEFIAWREFYGELEGLAKYLAPTLLQPLQSENRRKTQFANENLWREVFEQPIGRTIAERFKDDIVRGVVLTDALIGTFVSAQDLQANRCFLYHLIGNGTGQWRVPQGGMGAFVTELNRVALLNGVEINVNSHVIEIDSSANGVSASTASGNKYVATDLLFAGAPQTLAKLRGKSAPSSLEGSQMKINMLLSRLPRLKSGLDPKLAFAGTFHINESYSQLESAYQVAKGGNIPSDLPLEMYCHTLTDPTILSPELSQRGFHTLTLFGLHTPAALFDTDPSGAKEAAKSAAISSLNQYLEEPIESVLAVCTDGSLAIEAKSPIDLDTDLGLPRGNIFHRDLDFPFIDGTEGVSLIWGSETDDTHIHLAGAGARRGGGVSGIAGHNAAMAVLAKD